MAAGLGDDCNSNCLHPPKFFLMSAILSLEMLERLDTGEIKYGLLCFTSSLQVWLKFIIMFDSCLLLHVIVGFC